jgi:hypothetical protein
MLIARLNFGGQAPNLANIIRPSLSFIYGNAEVNMENDRTYNFYQPLCLPLTRRPLGAGPVVSRITSSGSTVCWS